MRCTDVHKQTNKIVVKGIKNDHTDFSVNSIDDSILSFLGIYKSSRLARSIYEKDDLLVSYFNYGLRFRNPDMASDRNC